MLNLLAKLFPAISALVLKLWPDGGRAAELKAKADLIEAQAFAAGRPSPKYVLGYVGAGAVGLFCMAAIVHFLFPGVFPNSPVEILKHLTEECAHWVGFIFEQ